MSSYQHIHYLRVRYSETDRMGNYYHSRALEWFECARSEWCRAAGKSYDAWEASGIRVPLVEAHVEYEGRAGYDDRLKLTSTASWSGRARLRFDVTIEDAETGAPICHGYTIHAVTDGSGKPVRPPGWLRELVDRETG